MGLVLITGAAGFLGSRLVEMLGDRDPGVAPDCLVNPSPWISDQVREARLQALGMTMLRVDIRDPASLASLTQPYEMVFHLASQTETSDPDQAATDFGCRALIDQLLGQGFRGTFVFASSLAVNDHRADYTHALGRSDFDGVRSVSRYGRAKLAAEQYLLAQSKRHGFKLRIVRFGTVYGPQPRANGLFDSVERLIAKNSLITRLNWPGSTALIHKDDACRLLMRLGLDEESPDPIRVYGVTEHLTLQQICQYVSEEMQREYRAVEMPRVFWRLVAAVSKQTWRLEPVLPLTMYNFLWRTALITHNTLHVQDGEVAPFLDHVTPHRFKECCGEVLGGRCG